MCACHAMDDLTGSTRPLSSGRWLQHCRVTAGRNVGDCTEAKQQWMQNPKKCLPAAPDLWSLKAARIALHVPVS